MNTVLTLTVQVKGVKEAQTLCNAVAAFPFDIDLRQHRYVVVAKSILGILSLDLSQPLQLDAYTDDVSTLKSALGDFII